MKSKLNLQPIRNQALTPLCRMVSSTITLWIGPFLVYRVPGLFLSLPGSIEIHVSNANSVDLDQNQTPCSAASNLGLPCSPVSLL